MSTTVNEDTIEVLRVIHGQRDLPTLLEDL